MIRLDAAMRMWTKARCECPHSDDAVCACLGPVRIGVMRRGVRAMARQVGVTPSHLSRVLSGERTPSKRLRFALESRGVTLGQQARKG